MIKAILAKTCNASVACFIFMMMLSEVSQAQFQGKIFTSPEERAYLDALRDDFLKKNQEQGFDITEGGPPPLPEAEEQENTEVIEYTLGGILTRSDGSHTVWLNNRPVPETDLPANMKLVTNGPLVVLSIKTELNTFQLKPGQTLNASTGETKEAYQRAPIPEAKPNIPVNGSDTDVGSTTDGLTPDNIPEETPLDSPAPEMETDIRETP